MTSTEQAQFAVVNAVRWLRFWQQELVEYRADPNINPHWVRMTKHSVCRSLDRLWAAQEDLKATKAMFE